MCLSLKTSAGMNKFHYFEYLNIPRQISEDYFKPSFGLKSLVKILLK